MAPIRILQVFTVLNRGGAETMMMNYYRHMDLNKVQFDFLVHREEIGAYEEEIKALGGRIYRMPPIYPKYFNLYQKKLVAFFEEHPEYQIIHCHLSELGYFIYKVASEHHIPYIIGHAHSSGMLINLKAPFRLYFKYKSRKYITIPFACSTASGRWLFGNKKSKEMIVMRNAVDSKRFKYSKDKAEYLREKLELKDKLVLGHIGSFSKVKNHRFLIRMFKRVKEEIPNACLVLVGNGKLQPRIKREVKKLGLEASVRFLGSRGDVDELLQAFDLFVFPSLFEGLPMTVIEAQASGVKCLLSDTISSDACIVGKLVEYISLKKMGEWVERIKQLSVEVEQLRASRESPLNEIKLKGYDIEIAARSIQALYLELLGEGERNGTDTDCLYSDL